MSFLLTMAVALLCGCVLLAISLVCGIIGAILLTKTFDRAETELNKRGMTMVRYP